MDIISLLEAKGIEWVDKGAGEIAIHCPNAHNHQGGVDALPSFNINVEKLVGHCFSCNLGMLEAGLTNWLTDGQLDDLTKQALKIRSRLKSVKSIKECMLEVAEEFDMMPPSEPWLEDYRGISAETYRKLGARHCKVGRYKDRLFFPITMHGRTLGIDARSLNPEEKIKYLRPSGCNAKEWLFPLDRAKEAKITRVILTEGIFGAINWLDKVGIPEALSYFGSNNFSTFKLQQLLGLGVEYIVIFPDNDKAGWKAADDIGNMCKDWLPVYVAAAELMPEGKDLGDLTLEEIELCMKNKRRFI